MEGPLRCSCEFPLLSTLSPAQGADRDQQQAQRVEDVDNDPFWYLVYFINGYREIKGEE